MKAECKFFNHSLYYYDGNKNNGELIEIVMKKKLFFMNFKEIC